MRKIFPLWLIALAALLVTACTPEVEDKFDQSSAKRAEESITQTQQLLTSNKAGWVMHYYGRLDLGGYNLLCQFDGDKVTISDEDSKTATSHYKLEQSAGTVLSFDEYNEVFHYYSDPAVTDFSTDGKPDGKGFNGDLEFRVISTSADSIVMEGKKHGDRIVMVPLEAGSSWKDYMNKTLAVRDSMADYNNFAIVVDRDTLPATLDQRCLTVTGKDGKDFSVPFVVTPKGYSLYEPLDINGKTIKAFDYSSSSEWKDPDNANVALVPVIYPLNKQLVTNLWYFKYSGLSERAQAFWDISYELQEKYKEDTRYLILGNYEMNWLYGKTYGLSFSHVYGNTHYEGTLTIDYELIGNDEVKMTYVPQRNVPNASWYIRNYRYDAIIYPIATEKGRTFKLSCDNPRHPAEITMTDVDDPTNVITVYQDFVSWPFYY